MANIKILHVPQKIWVTAFSSNDNNWNLPMHDTSFSIYKNSPASIEFQILNVDRKPINIFDRKIVINLMHNDELLLQRECICVNISKATYKLNLEPLDTYYWPEGPLKYSMMMEDENGIQELLYLDTNQNSVGGFTVKTGALPPLKDSTVILPTDFITDLWGTPPKIWFKTGHYRVDSKRGNHQLLISMAIYATKFSATFKLQGSLDVEFPADNSWFDILLDSKHLINFEKYTGIYADNFHINVQYIRFVYLPDHHNIGTLDKIIFRV